MARVRGRGNKSTEGRLARLFRQSGIKGWRRHLPLPGTPDFAFPKERLAIFADGCFWHGCPKHATFPTTRRKFWLRKFADNKARDRRVNRELYQRGWRALRIWEHELTPDTRCRCLARIRHTLTLAGRLWAESSGQIPLKTFSRW